MKWQRTTLIGLSGTNGSGKDTVGHLLEDQHDYLFISVTDLLREELTRRQLPIDREHLRELSAEWRRSFGMGVLVDRAVTQFAQQKGAYAGLVLASLRNPLEADRVHELGGAMVWIDADPHVRYARIQANAATRGRGGEDDKTYEQFLDEEQAEMHASGDEATLNMSAVKDRCDEQIMNDSDDVQALGIQVEQTLGLSASHVA